MYFKMRYKDGERSVRGMYGKRGKVNMLMRDTACCEGTRARRCGE